MPDHTQDKWYRKVEAVLASTGEVGKPTGGTRYCTLEGCNGLRLGVRWPDGKITFPCLKGMHSVDEYTLQID